jgi:hypothetical protein
VIMDVPPGTEFPSPIDARDVQCMIEVKHDDVVQGQPPKLSKSGTAMRSTYGSAATSRGSKCTPHEQMLDYDCFALAAQGLIRDFMFGLLVTFMRLQITYADRAGCMLSEERNFSEDFSVLFAIIIAVYKLETRRAGLQSAITTLSGPGDTPLEPLDFDTSDRAVRTGAMTNISRPITPFQVRARLASPSAEHVSVFARGVNLMERPMAIDWEAAQSSRKNSTPNIVVRTRPSIARLAKSNGLVKTQAIAVSEGATSAKRSTTLPRQFAPRCIFGSGVARYHCVVDANSCRSAGSTLQLSWQPKSRLSEATVLRLANERGIPGVPTLIGSGDIANTDDSVVRSSLQLKFAGLPSIRPVNNVLRAIVWREDCIPLSSVGDIHDFLSASQSILQGKLCVNDGTHVLMHQI